MPGINAKMNELQAAVGLLMLDVFEEERRRRNDLSDIYQRRLATIPGIRFQEIDSTVRHNYYNMPIIVDKEQYGLDRDELYTILRRYNIFSRKYFYPLCSQFQCYRNHPSAAPSNLPIAKYISERILILPLYGALCAEDINRICNILEYQYQKNADKIFHMNMMTRNSNATESNRISAF